MRPTGRMHIGHYHGALKNWVKLQEEYECLYFAADWHALTTHFDSTESIADSVWEMFVDWLAAGINPTRATIFIQSRVPEHAELALLLGMIAPVGWLERVPTYKDQQQKLADRDLSNYGFLGYPVMQAADILIYRANMVPVGEDQVSHIELVRELARRFNFIYGREAGIRGQGEGGGQEARREKGAPLWRAAHGVSGKGRRRCARGGERPAERNAESLARRPRAAVRLPRRLAARDPAGARPAPDRDAESPRSRRPEDVEVLGNAILMREEPAEVTQKIRTMQTDPARVRRSDKGDPNRCPVWPLHQIYSDTPTRDWVVKGCTTAGIGCLECKQPLIDAIIREQEPIRERAQRYLDDPQLVRNIVADGCERARKLAEETMRDVRGAMGLDYT